MATIAQMAAIAVLQAVTVIAFGCAFAVFVPLLVSIVCHSLRKS